jgi:hypothetical protein
MQSDIKWFVCLRTNKFLIVIEGATNVKHVDVVLIEGYAEKSSLRSAREREKRMCVHGKGDNSHVYSTGADNKAMGVAKVCTPALAHRSAPGLLLLFAFGADD